MKKNKIWDNFLIWLENHLNKQTVLIALSILVGIGAGLTAVVLKKSVHYIRDLVDYGMSDKYANYLYFVYPTIGILIVVIFIKYILRKDIEHGIPGVLHAMSRENAKIKKHNMYSSVITSAITVGFGGSVGLEGPTVATGAAIGSNIGTVFKLNFKQTILMLGCATAAAIASIFKAPIAAVILVVEILMLDLTMSSILPLLIASATGTIVSYLFMGQEAVYHFHTSAGFSIPDLPFYIILGILSGLFSIYFTKVYLKINKFFDSIKNHFIKLLTGGLALGFLIFFLPSLYGEGYDAINLCLAGDYKYIFEKSIFYGLHESKTAIFFLLLAIVMLKVFASAATFGAGGVGGIFAPSLFIGANFGLLFAISINYFNFIDLPVSNFALVGMAAMISGIMHAPLTGIFLIAEITGGYSLFLPLIIVASMSYGMAKMFLPNSVYTIALASRGELLTHNADRNAMVLMQLESLLETNFKTILPEAKLSDLVKLVPETTRNIFVVVDAEGYFNGIVTLDAMRNIMFKPELYEKIYVRDLMFIPEVVITENDHIEDVAQKFNKFDKYNIALVKNGKYQGFISRANFFSTYRKILTRFAED